MEGRRIRITGIVQGVGFRPWIYLLAGRHGVAGWVRNSSAGVEIEIEGPPDALAGFEQDLRGGGPPRARIERCETERAGPWGHEGFAIRHSRSQEGDVLPVSPDLAICPDCRRELDDPNDRRYRYPFINCTNCGPRFTIITGIPWDRPQTTMAGFTLCPDCAAEYADPGDRRYHAEPVACPACGPQIWLEASSRDSAGDGPDSPGAAPDITGAAQDSAGAAPDITGATPNITGAAPDIAEAAPETAGECLARGEEAIARARALLAGGGIVAIKGLGGFHLACDATDPAAVAELRRRKERDDKPFALMARDLATIERYVEVSAHDRALLASPESPVVLMRLRTQPVGADDLTVRETNAAGEALTHGIPAGETAADGAGGGRAGIASGVAPGLDRLGFMLPYTPLHHLLLEPETGFPPVLVMTSGNLSDEPIAFEDDDARRRLGDYADAFLMHDRPIHMRCDDSVTADFRDSPLFFRRARGYAPVPIPLPRSTPPLLAVGGEYKNTFCLAREERSFVSHFIGEMASLEANRSFGRAVEHYETLFRIRPEFIVHDAHPDYQTTRYACWRAGQENLPLMAVQHHHAHIASVMADRSLDQDRRVIGVAFDGTGYGDDGAIWGGEFLIAGYESFVRALHLLYTPLPGGDAAIRNPCRVALGWLSQAGCEWSAELAPVRATDEEEREVLAAMIERGLNTIPTSSMGRLFDAAAALSGGRQRIAYEAQAACEFEALADRSAAGEYRYRLHSGQTPTARFGLIDPTDVIRSIVEDLRSGADPGTISIRFHRGTAAMVAETCRLLRTETGLDEVALSGGVWQNLLLLELTVALLEENGFTVHVHRRVPANDGGLSLGQAAVAAARLATDGFGGQQQSGNTSAEAGPSGDQPDRTGQN